MVVIFYFIAYANSLYLINIEYCFDGTELLCANLSSNK